MLIVYGVLYLGPGGAGEVASPEPQQTPSLLFKKKTNNNKEEKNYRPSSPPAVLPPVTATCTSPPLSLRPPTPSTPPLFLSSSISNSSSGSCSGSAHIHTVRSTALRQQTAPTPTPQAEPRLQEQGAVNPQQNAHTTPLLLPPSVSLSRSNPQRLLAPALFSVFHCLLFLSSLPSAPPIVHCHFATAVAPLRHKHPQLSFSPPPTETSSPSLFMFFPSSASPEQLFRRPHSLILASISVVS